MVLLIGFALFLGALGLLAINLLAHRRQQRLVTQRLQGDSLRNDKMGQLLRQLGNTRIGQRTISLDNETQDLLNRIGWRKANQRSMFAACQIGSPIVLLGLTVLIQSLFFPDVTHVWPAPFLALAVGYLLPKRVLATLANVARNKSATKFRPSSRCCASSSSRAWPWSKPCGSCPTKPSSCCRY